MKKFLINLKYRLPEDAMEWSFVVYVAAIIAIIVCAICGVFS